MSLEALLAENTAAVRELTAALRAGAALALGPNTTPEQIDASIKAENASPKPEAPTSAETPAAPAPSPSTAEVPATAPEPKAAPQPAPQADAPDYATTAGAINALVKARGRQVAVDVLGQFKAANLKAIKPEQYADVIAACEAAAETVPA